MSKTHTPEEWLQIIENNWNDIGACGSCGCHALFSEHSIDKYDIAAALKDNGEMTVYCISKDDEDSIDHRGARFNLYDLKEES